MSKNTTDDELDQSLQQKKTFKKHRFANEGERYNELADLYLRQKAAFKRRRMAAVRAAAQHTYGALNFQEVWTSAEPRIGSKIGPLDFASKYFPTVYMLIITKCLSTYEQRLEQDTDEARAERAHCTRLKASVVTDADTSKAIRDNAQ